MGNHNIEICPNCGAELKYSQILKKKVCKYCGFGEDENNFKNYINSAIENDARIQFEKTNV